MGSKIYVKSWGPFWPLLCSIRKWPFLFKKNDKMILHHIFEDLIEGFEPRRPPQPSKKTYFLKILKIFLKIVKSWGGQRGSSWFQTLQNDFTYHYSLIFLFEAQRSYFHQKISIWKYERGLRRPPASKRVNVSKDFLFYLYTNFSFRKWELTIQLGTSYLPANN